MRTIGNLDEQISLSFSENNAISLSGPFSTEVDPTRYVTDALITNSSLKKMPPLLLPSLETEMDIRTVSWDRPEGRKGKSNGAAVDFFLNFEKLNSLREYHLSRASEKQKQIWYAEKATELELER